MPGKESWLMPAPDGSRALNHIVVVLSLDNVLGRLYGPGTARTSTEWSARS